MAQLVKNLPAMQETPVRFLGQENRWRRDRLPPPVFLGFPCGSTGKESACNAGDLSSIPGLGRSPREGKGYPLQNSGLENSMDGIVHGVAKSQMQLSLSLLFVMQNWFARWFWTSFSGGQKFRMKVESRMEGLVLPRPTHSRDRGWPVCGGVLWLGGGEDSPGFMPLWEKGGSVHHYWQVFWHFSMNSTYLHPKL